MAMLPNNVESEDVKNETKEQENETQEIGYKKCGFQTFYNLIQYTSNIFDLRSAEQFKKSHVNQAEHLEDPMELDEFDVWIDRNLLTYPIVIYGDNDTVSDEVAQHLWTLIKTMEIKDASLYVFQGEYEKDIYAQYSFLCDSKIKNNFMINMDISGYPNMILENELFLGDGMMAENENIMQDLKITHIVNVTRMDFMLNKEIQQKITFCKLPIDDSSMEADKMPSHFETAANFIDDALINDNKDKNNRVFVHCMAGISRSASIVISYLMRSRKYTLVDAYVHVKTCRPQIMPNHGFMQRLIEYEQKLFNKSTDTELLKAFGTMENKYYHKIFLK